MLHKHQYLAFLNNCVKCTEKIFFMLVFVHISSETTGKTTDPFNTRIHLNFGKWTRWIFFCTRANFLHNRGSITWVENKWTLYNVIILRIVIVIKHINLYFCLFLVNNFCSNSGFVIKVYNQNIINIPSLIQHLWQK